MTTTEKAIDWWNRLSIRVKWDLFLKYNPILADMSLNIGLDLNNVYDYHIEEIWQKETL